MLSCHDEKTGFEIFFKILREFQVRNAGILANAQEVQQAFKDGTAKRGSVDDLVADLLG